MEKIATPVQFVSIVTPTHNRRDSLHRTLLALIDQDVSRTCFEVIVIADGCTDGTVDLLQDVQAALPYSLRWIEQERGGPAIARNTAISHARGSIIVFLDDDVVPVAGWLSAHIACHANDDRAVVIGPLSPGSQQRPAWVRWEDATLQQQYRAMLAGAYRPTPRQFYTGNSSVRRHWILQVGGFDGRLLRAEDVELAFRLQDLGLHFHFEPLADALHHSYRTFHSWRAIPRQYGRNDVLMYREHGRAKLLHQIGGEFRDRRRSIQRVARWCIGRPLLYSVAVGSLGIIARGANHLDRYRVSAAACSGIWNLAYWQGLCDALGGRASFWRLVRTRS